MIFLMRILVVVSFLCPLFVQSQASKEIFVSTKGSDKSVGSKEHPLLSISKAVDLAKSIKEPTIVYIREGVYYLSEPIVFQAANARTESNPLVVKNYQQEKVTISGAKKIMLQWKSFKGEIVQAKIPSNMEFDQFFVNGELQHMARYPNYNPSAKIFNGTAADAIDTSRTKNWHHFVGGYVHALHRSEWGDFHYQITGKNAQGDMVLEGGWQNNRQMGMHKTQRFVENVLEELDTLNEWYADKPSRSLYYYHSKNTNLSNAVFGFPQLKSLFEFRGTEQHPVTNITIQGLTLTQTLRTFMQTKEPLLRSDWTIYRGGAIFLEGAAHCYIKDCAFDNLGGNGVFYSNYNRNNQLSGSHFEQCGASAICFVGDPNAVRSPLFEYKESQSLESVDRVAGPKSNNYPAECLVYDNLIHDIGRIEKQVAGVEISMSQDITVGHNTIYDVPRAGINIGDGTWGGHIIEFNDVFNTVLETGDHGSFNSWGRDRYWHPSRDSMDKITSKDRDGLVLLDAVKTVIIRNNRFRCDHGWDIDLDDGSSNYHIYNNLLLNGGLKLREGFFRTVENNMIVNNYFHPHVWFKNSGDVFVHNIVTIGYYPIRILVWGKQVDHNIFLDSLGLVEAQKKGTDKESIFMKPLFADAKNGDYTLLKSAPAFDIGYKNFNMYQFGVVNKKLQGLAKKVTLPTLIGNKVAKPDEVFDFMEMTIKEVGAGERSAAGLEAERGVYVKEVKANSELKTYVRPNDVVLMFNGQIINKVADLQRAKIALRKKEFAIKIMRDQKEQVIQITLK